MNIQSHGYWSRNKIQIIFLAITVNFLLISLFFQKNLVPVEFIISGYFTVLAFFLLNNVIARFLINSDNRTFIFVILLLSLLIRLFGMIFLYFYYSSQTGQPFEFNAVDSLFYHENGIKVSKHLHHSDFKFNEYLGDMGFSDRGYNIFLGFIYYLFGESIFIVRIVNVLLSTATVYLVYKLCNHITTPETSRVASIMVCLLPNFTLYTGTHLKETLMIFLVQGALLLIVMFVKKSGFITGLLLIATILFLFAIRTILGSIIFLSFISYLFINNRSSSRIVNLFAGILLSVVFMVLLLNSEIGIELLSYLEKLPSSQAENMEFRATRDGGNKFALLAGAPLFLSIILIAPFPSFILVEQQELLWLFIGANQIRNIYAFFTLAGIFFCIKKYSNKTSILLIFLFGYLLILANSPFAISERFHLPAVPVLVILAAIGLINFQESQLWKFKYYLVFIIILSIAWNYIKLTGRL